MAVIVNFWAPKIGTRSSSSEVNIGHASIMVEGLSSSDSVYLSVWPGSDLAFIFGGGSLQTFADDIDSESGYPRQVRMTKLDEEKIRLMIAAVKRSPKYGFLTVNCAVQASICLHAGVPLSHQIVGGIAGVVSFPLMYAAYPVSFTPWGLYTSAKLLSLKYS